MKPLLIVTPTQPGRCRSCGAAIEWATTVHGSRVPLDPPVRFAARLDVDDLGDGVHIREIDRTVTRSHFATCPDAAVWRRHRAARAH